MNEHKNTNWDLLTCEVMAPLAEMEADIHARREAVVTATTQLHKDFSDKHTAECAEMIDRIHTLQTAGDRESLSALQSLTPFLQELSDLTARDRQLNVRDGHNFNVFSLLAACGVGIGETCQSRLLKFLLEANGMHGQGSLFLWLFLKRLGIRVSDDFRKEHWTVLTEEGRIDVLLTRTYPLSVVVIENKSNWAIDQPNQLYRYWLRAIYPRTQETDRAFYEREKARFRIVYLAPDDGKVPDGQTRKRPSCLHSPLPAVLPMEVDVRTFDGFICQWLGDCIQALPPENHALREFLRQYQALCKTL